VSGARWHRGCDHDRHFPGRPDLRPPRATGVGSRPACVACVLAHTSRFHGVNGPAAQTGAASRGPLDRTPGRTPPRVPAVRAPAEDGARQALHTGPVPSSAVSCAVVSVPGPDARGWLDSVRRLEQEGWDALLVPDTMWTPSPFPALAAAAAVTSRLRLRTWVLAAPMRSAAAVVREASALQQLSGGRFELGIGPGRPDAEGEAARLGVSWGSAADRIGQVEHVADAVRRGVQPAPPIVVTAAGDRMLAAAGRVADRIGLAAPPQATAEDLAAMAARAGDAVARGGAGRRVSLTQQVLGIHGRLPQWLARSGLDAAALSAAGAVGMLAGSPQQMVRSILERRDRLGIDEVVVPAEMADDFLPVLEGLSGRR
jgi:alkanesulfonate monooxygenase SsuD/methylene tetrahydromethanopterin reductase-like flavin-dependent oxidoreductase (luciferase family)